ncbi:MAG: magnesium transporter [Alphaproteobacteria bacterium PA2]|nr:MAG: magnesium transporter [Alphaproteobacteria bacterium PA2]
MLRVLRRDAHRFDVLGDEDLAAGWRMPQGVVWADMNRPSRSEELAAEYALGLQLPTPEEMQQIEPSSRLYREGGATFMTASLLTRSDQDVAELSPVTFVLSSDRLITIRFIESKAFDVFSQRVLSPTTDSSSGADTFLGLMDAIVERVAEVLEAGSGQVQASSTAIFSRLRGGAFEPLLTSLARTQSTTSLARTSLVSLGRLASFAALAPEIADDPAHQVHLASVQHDIQSLTEHSGYQASHISFLLDAALGLINIEQNVTMKFFAVATVLLMPPTLIGAIYGMNFRHMPELDWPLGYPMAIGLMILSGLIPFLWFRRKGWF